MVAKVYTQVPNAIVDGVRVYADFRIDDDEAASYVAQAREDNPGRIVDELRLHATDDGGVDGWVVVRPERFRRIGRRFE